MLARSAVRLAWLMTALVVVASACSPGGAPRATSKTSSTAAHPDVAKASPTPTPSPSEPSPSEPAPPPSPPEGACYRLSFDELAQSANNDHPYLCGKRHTTQTIFVGRLHATDGVDSDAARAQMSRVCPRRMKHYLGGSRTDRHLSRFNVVWFVPSPEQAAAGARWFRCDVIAFGRSGHLYPLPRPRRLHGLLDGSAALGSYGLCGTAAPGSAHFERVICARHHSWRAVSTIRFAGDTYPGRHAVRAEGNGICKDRARAQAGLSLRYSYGWEWPTHQQWRNGQHYGFCWAPG